MACVALTSLMATIELEFLKPNHRVSLDDEKPLKSLFEKLSSLQAFLQKQESNGGAPIRDLETKIRDFALKAEDGIELQLSSILLAKDREYQDKARGELHQTLQEVAEDAEELLKIVNNTSSEPEAGGDTHPSIHWLKPASQPENVVLGGQSSPCSPNLEDHFNEDAFNAVYEMLFHTLLGENIVSIVGMPGVGKTTLAKRVYASKMARSYIRGWVTVPQEYNLRDILLDLLQSMRPAIKNINEGSTLDQLIEELYKHLGGKEKRYFIVLDNIPNTQAWVDIKTCLPDDPHQIVILLTTQFYIVGRYAAHHVHEMCALDSDRSWKLFCKRLSLKEHMTPKFEEIGKRVVEECEGLPRSIVAVAKRLSKCDYTLQEWNKIEKEVESLGPLYNDAEHLSKLTLFYNQLPQHLKVCFLYFAIYPKGFKINVKRLIRIWIAEGFVRQLGHEELEKEAYFYLHDLVRSGLVSISKWEHKMTNVCWIHSSLWDFCIREAKKEGILCAVNTQPYIGLSLDMFANSCRWLSLYSHRLDYYTLFSSNNPRSLFFFQGDSKTLVSFKLLRIVDLSALRILKRVPLHLGDLVFLRYLSVPQWFEGLDYVVSNNQNLQTLIVSGVESQPTGHLPFRIWELPHLRHLELGNFYTVDPPSMVKEQLQTLSWVSPTHFTKQVYYSFPNIKYLKVFYKDSFEPSHTHESCRNPISLDYIEYLSKLETLVVIVPEGSIRTHLERPVFPPQLKKLRLSGTNLPMKVLYGIGKLAMLKVLKLENAFNDGVWKRFGQFSNLKVLLIEATNLQRWEDFHFPKLKHLILRRCYCLEGIPSKAENFHTLETIKLEQCPPSVVTSAMYIQDKRKARHAMRFQTKPMDYNTKCFLEKRYPPLTVVVDGVIHDFRSG